MEADLDEGIQDSIVYTESLGIFIATVTAFMVQLLSIYLGIYIMIIKLSHLNINLNDELFNNYH